MSKQHPNIDSDLAAWITKQHVFFVATAPLSPKGHVNLSPKGGDAFRVLGPLEVVYQDYTGSGVETVSHINENSRIVVMFCAFEGPPKIVRIHGHGTIITQDNPRFAEMVAHFPSNLGTRSYIHITVNRVSDSCGYSVPFYEFQKHRDALDRWAENKGPDGLIEYRATKNKESIDGLPAFTRTKSHDDKAP